MSNSKQLGLAMSIAYNAHQGQTRFDGVTPYIAHVKAVADSFAEGFDGLKTVAWLHDVLEDTSLTPQALLSAGIRSEYVEAVQAITKGPGEDYDGYLIRVKENHLAREVKIYDILNNLSDNPTRNMVKKYAKALKFLISRNAIS
jgi:(p)ppGpp synthase/HD superfamily hydrolase